MPANGQSNGNGKSSAVRGEFRGNPTISLVREGKEKWPFSFGVEKASLIVEHIDEIKKFVEDNPKQ